MHPYTYRVHEKKDWQARWITAPDKYLAQLEIFPEGGIPLGQWIWPEPYSRVHLRRDFHVKKSVGQALVQLQCDNEFCLYINGKAIVPVKGEYVWDTGVRNISELLADGDNFIGVRAYQTADPRFFTSALRGGFQLLYKDGSRETILTDEAWTAWGVSNFYKDQEPAGWETAVQPGNAWKLICTPIHPRLLRRSCCFRKEFVLDGDIREAVLHGTARGLYEACINGQPVSDGCLLPGSMEKYTLYQSVPVTGLLRTGDNVLAAVTGNGWLNCTGWGMLRARKPALLLELEIRYRDGRTRFIGTDGSFRVMRSSITDNDLQFGERVDARMDIPGWNDVNCDAGGWVAAEVLAKRNDDPPLVMQECPPVKVTERIRSISCREIKTGVYLLDFGHNAAGRASIVLRDTQEGTPVIVRYYERMEDGVPQVISYSDVYFPSDSQADGKAWAAAKNMDVYICKGAPVEVFSPRFTYTGFRYMTVEGFSTAPDPDDITFRVMHNDLPVTGSLDTDCAAVREIWEATTRTYRSNIHTGPTDCPTREKNFWNGDIQAFADTACWYMDNFHFLSRWTDAGRKTCYGVYGWEDEEYILPWTLYRFYGDREILRIRYPVIAALIEKRLSACGGILPDGSAAPFRDHLAIRNVPGDFYAGCYHCLMLKRAAQIAGVLGYADDAQRFVALYEAAKAAFNEQYLLGDEADYTPRCQGGLVLPLAFDLAPPEQRDRLGGRLAKYVEDDGYHPTTGFMATGHLLPLLCDFGYIETAWKTLMQTGYPSWRYMFSTGATTITASWQAHDHPVGSVNHYALGSVCRWFFEYLGGIRPDDNKAAFEKFILKPVFIREMGRFRTSYQSPYGTILSSWETHGDGFRWEFIVPPSTTARVILPGRESVEYQEGKYMLRID